MVPELEQLVAEHGRCSCCVTCPTSPSERPSVWGADLRFGREFHKKITKMAIVGDGHWEKLVADLAHPFYAQEEAFHTEDEAWEWLTS